jgi:MFS family permease
MLTFTPIYLRVVRDQSVIEIGLLMLPITFGSGIGSLLTGQIVSRIGRSAIFPSVGLSAFAVLLAILGLYAESMSTAAFAWYLGFAAIATGAVMGIVQVTVQAEVGATMLGTSIGLISLSRALGGATGTAMIGATLFATLAATGVEISTELQALLQGGSSDLAALGHTDETEIRGEVAFAFHGVFFLIALYSAIGSALAWTLPRRTI